jgi:hypothetical protein
MAQYVCFISCIVLPNYGAPCNIVALQQQWSQAHDLARTNDPIPKQIVLFIEPCASFVIGAATLAL